jgi:hypothetical protein
VEQSGALGEGRVEVEVTTAFTPGIRVAAEVSIETMRAW